MKKSCKIISILFGVLVTIGYAGISERNAWQPIEFWFGLFFGILATLSLLRKPPIRVSLFIPLGIMLTLFSLLLLTGVVNFDSRTWYLFSWSIVLALVYMLYIYQSYNLVSTKHNK